MIEFKSIHQIFGAAILEGMAASPFSTTPDAPLVVVVDQVEHQIVGCAIRVGDNAQKAGMYGLAKQYTIQAHIPKDQLPSKPREDADSILFGGRQYTIITSSGDEPVSTVWVVHGTAPM